MMKSYSEFLAVVESKIALYSQIPERHFSVEGQKVYELYRAIEFLVCFASNATELLGMLNDDEDVKTAAKYTEAEYNKIRRCLERLAAAEKAPAA